MAKAKYLNEITDLFEKSPVVNFSSIERIINKKKKSKGYAKQLVRNLILREKVKKLSKGFYTKYDDSSLAVFCFKPAYLGLQDALSFHNLWEQETISVIITARKVRQGIRKVLGVNVLVRRINKKYLFGFDYIKCGDFYLPVSDIEKTFIDMIYFKEKIDKETLKNIKSKINKKKLSSYLRFYPKMIRKRILRYLE
ncbi:hypothetical protein BMS3Abin17_00017 [archaeon BMS3Abin17]|nr:hypothetical protein BMS3Abin17_00017 [archaeon BMS3Abin17]HDZ61250.1 hypothetical protein [Candidatus Pacearchaeota archaeon]